MADDIPRPQGTVEVGDITITSAPDQIEIPEFIQKRDIFRAGRPTGKFAHFTAPLADGADPSTLQVKQVELFDLNFCGTRFKEESYFSFEDFGRGAQREKLERVGVGETLAKRLIAAQEEIYVAFAKERSASKGPINEAAFDAWCAIRQKNGGFGFRSGPHSGGSAIDLNVRGCPYTTTGTADKSIMGGEITRKTPADKAEALRERFSDGLTAYLNAVRFVNSDDATFDLSPKVPGEDPALLYGRFQVVHMALIEYFSFGYNSRNPATGIPKSLAPGELHAPVSLDEFVARVSTEFDIDPGKPNSFASRHPSFQAGMAGDRTAFLTPKFQQMQADHEALRFVMIHENMIFKPRPGDPKKKICDISALSTRDPCFGFMDLRQEIVVALINKGLRWGGAMFSDVANGDIMHFDLGEKVNPDLKDDPNPEKLGYRKRP